MPPIDGAEDEARVIHAQAFGKQAKLRRDHVLIAVARKSGAELIARFARFPMTNSVRHHNEELRCIERLSRAEELAGKFGSDELRATARRAVGDQDRISDYAPGVFHRFA